MIIVKDQDHKVKSDLKSRSKGLEMILDQDHLKSDLRSKITQIAWYIRFFSLKN